MLDIIIPQYMEDEHTIKNLLDSIMNQKNIDFNDIQVTIINDASTCILSNEFLMNYEKLNIIYLRNDKNLGPGLTRQRGIDSTDEPFIMFMDADDEYINSNVLSRILDYLKKYNPNYLVTNIMVEVYVDNQKSLRLRKREERFARCVCIEVFGICCRIWPSPSWKDLPHTGVFRLQIHISAFRGQERRQGRPAGAISKGAHVAGISRLSAAQGLVFGI